MPLKHFAKGQVSHKADHVGQRGWAIVKVFVSGKGEVHYGGSVTGLTPEHVKVLAKQSLEADLAWQLGFVKKLTPGDGTSFSVLYPVTAKPYPWSDLYHLFDFTDDGELKATLTALVPNSSTSED